MFQVTNFIWNPIFGIYHAYTWYIPCICRCPTYTWNIHGISMDLPFISIEVDICSISMDIPCISTQYIHGYTWHIIWCIYMVYMSYIHEYSWLSEIRFCCLPVLLDQCWSHSVHTLVWMIKSVLFHTPPWQLCQGKRLTTKGSTRLPPTFPLCRLLLQWLWLLQWCCRFLPVFLVL